MKRQFPGNTNDQRCDPRFSGGRGRGRRGPPSRGQNFSSTASAGAGRGGPHRGGPPRMNGGRGRPTNHPPAARGSSQPIFGRGGYQRNNQPPPPPPPPPQNNNNNFIMTNRYGQVNMGRGRGRGGNIVPGRDLLGGRYNFRSSEQQQQRIPIGPPRGRGFGRGIHRLPPPPPPPPQPLSSNIPWQGAQLASTQSYQQGIGVGTRIENRIVHIQNGHLPQPRQASHQQQQQQYQPTKHIPFQQLQSQQHEQLSVTLNNNNSNSNYTGYQQSLSIVANTSNLVNQQQFQATNTVTRNNTMQQQLHQKQVPVANTISTTTMTQSSIPTIAVAKIVAKTPTNQEIDEAWKEYTAPGGVKYYHNALLKESTYHKPDVLKKKEQANNSDHKKTSSSQNRSWQEYQDANTRKLYYSDGVSTTWEKPVGYISPDTIVANTSLASEREERNNRELPSKKKKRSSTATSSSSGKVNDKPDKGDSFANKKEAIAAFKGLLLAKAISPMLKWNEVIKACQSDSRWEPLEEVLSMGERKQALAEYQTKRTNEIRNDQRQERVRAKEAFGQLLADVLPPVSGFSARSSRFIEVRKALSKDDRFYAVEDEATRESLFLDFCDEYKKRQERKKRSRKWEAQESFGCFLQEIEEGGTLTYASTWESFLVSLPEKDKADSRFATSVLLSNSDRQLHFSDFVIELQKVEDDKRRRIRDARCRAEKAQRDKYRELLHQMAVVGKIFPSSRWREIEGLLLKDDAFKMVVGQNRDSPRELFETFVDKWDLMYRRERSFLCRLLHPPGKLDVVISAGTTYDSFKNSITNQASYSSEIQNETFRIINKDDPVSSACLLHNELTARSVDNKPYKGSRRGSTRDDSSEDEGEIIEDRELKDDDVVELQ